MPVGLPFSPRTEPRPTAVIGKTTYPPNVLLRALSASYHSLRASGQLEAGDAGLPWPSIARSSADLVILVDIPEGAVVRRIDIHGSVVPPTGVRRCLYARAVNNSPLTECHLSQRFPRYPA